MLSQDPQLVRRCLKGEAHAFDLLYARHAPGVYRLLRRLVGEATCAEDLTQETFISAFRSLGNWQQRSTFRTWLFGIAVRLYRHSQASRYATSTSELENMLEDPAPDSDPLDYVTRQQAQHLIEQTIQELPPEYREVFVLLRVEGLKQREAALALELPIGTVQSRLWRGICLLRQRLGELEVVVPMSETRSQAVEESKEQAR
jgi:RNA polymerase sigma-70 factor (ECF subfamily)